MLFQGLKNSYSFGAYFGASLLLNLEPIFRGNIDYLYGLTPIAKEEEYA